MRYSGRKYILSFLLISACFSTLAFSQYADVIYENGVIYTNAADDTKRADTLAVKDGRIIAIGEKKDVSVHLSDDTEVVDLNKQVVFPGLIDAHAHYVRGGLRDLFNCTLPPSVEASQIASLVAACAENTPKGEWVTGGPWPQAYIEGNRAHKDKLDAVVKDHPVFLLDDTGHNGYVNSKALEVLGLDETTAKDNIEVLKDSSGQLTGIVLESAAGEVLKKIPAPEAQHYEQAAKWSVEKANKNGITAFAEARTDRATLNAYSTLDKSEGLNADVVTYLQYDTDFNESHDFQEETVEIRGELMAPRVHVDNIKLYLDGVPPAYNALLLAPYEIEGHDHGDDFLGEMRMEEERIKDVVLAMDKKGMSVKMHATGDGSVRAALDAVEYARKNGGINKRHSIAHVGLVADEDLPRFKELNVVADIAPPLWIPGAYSEAMVASIGEKRYEDYIPTGDLFKAGALVAYGSDWPSMAADINPWPHIESLVDRKVGEHQSVSLNEALRFMTENAAEALNLENEIGSLETGKKANFIVISNSPYEVPVTEIGKIETLKTFYEGRPVFQK